MTGNSYKLNGTNYETLLVMFEGRWFFSQDTPTNTKRYLTKFEIREVADVGFNFCAMGLDFRLLLGSPANAAPLLVAGGE